MTEQRDRERLADLEARFAFLDDQLQTLDGVVVAQRSRIEELETQLDLLRKTLETMDVSPGGDALEPPPRTTDHRLFAPWFAPSCACPGLPVGRSACRSTTRIVAKCHYGQTVTPSSEPTFAYPGFTVDCRLVDMEGRRA